MRYPICKSVPADCSGDAEVYSAGLSRDSGFLKKKKKNPMEKKKK